MSTTAPDTPAEASGKSPRTWRRLLRKMVVRLLLLPILVVAFVVLLVYVPPVQQIIRGKAVVFLTARLGTRVELERLQIGFPLRLRLQGLFIADQRGDTLLYADRVHANAGLVDLLGGKLLLEQIDLGGVRADLRQSADSTFNFQFILQAFASGAPKAAQDADTTSGFQFDVRHVHLEQIRFDMDLEPSELALRSDIGELDISLDSMRLDPLQFHVNEVSLRRTRVDLRTTSGEPAPPRYPELTNPLAAVDIRFKQMSVEDVRFGMATVDTGDSLWVALANGVITTREVDAARQRLHLSTVDLAGLQLGIVSTTGADRPSSMDTVPLWLDRHDGFRYWTQDWDLAVDQLKLSHGEMAFHTDSISAPTLLLDPAHLAFADVGLGARDVQVNNGRIALQLDSLAIHGGPYGDRVDLSARLDLTTAEMSVSNGTINAMGNALAFEVVASPGDLSAVYRTPGSVPIEADMTGDLHLADLLPLLRQLGVDLPDRIAADERWHTRIWFAGTAEHVQTTGIELRGDQGSTIHAHGSISNAAQWPNSDHSILVDDLVLGAGLSQLVQAYAPPGVPLPKRLVFKGRAQGHGYDASTTVDLKSDLGDLSGRAAARDWKGMVPGHLDVDIAAHGIAIGRFTGDTAIGSLGFHVVAHGEGLHGVSRRGNLVITPTQFNYKGNDLSSLIFEAEVIHDSLLLALSSDAPAAGLQLNAQGPWPEAGDSLAFQLDLTMARMHLHELGVTPHVLNTEGRITGRIALRPGARGRLALQAPGLRVFNDDRTHDLERFALNVLLDSDSTAVDLDCDVARLGYHANLSIDSTITLVRERLLGAFKEPYAFNAPPGRRIDLNVDLPGTERLSSLLLPALKAMQVDRFEGHYDGDRDSLSLIMDIPLVDYAGVEVKGLLIDLHAAGPDLEGDLALLRVMRDSLHLDDVLLHATNEPGALRTQLRLRDGDTDRYRIGMDMMREDGVPVLHLQQELLLDRRSWTADGGNALYLDPRGLRAKDFVLRNGDQRVALRTADDGNHLEISALELSNITGLVRDEDSLAVVSGMLDAAVLLPMHTGERLRADVSLRRTEVMGVPLGTVSAQLEEDRDDHYQGRIDIDAGADRAQADLEVDLGRPETHVTVDADLDLEDLGSFKPFAEDYLFDLGGKLNGRLRYEQEGDAISVLGGVEIDEGRIGLIQTGAVYGIPRDSIVFDQQGLAFKDFVVLDAKGNRFQLDGRVNTAEEQVPGLDLRLRTERFQLVNSTEKDNPMFYGKLFSGIDLRIGGTATTPTVNGEVSVLDSTALSVVLPGSRVELIDHEGIVQFTADLDQQDTLVMRSDSEMLRDSLAAQLPGIDLDLRIKLDPNAHFAIVIDPTTGDAATFRGEADLNFRYNPDGDIYLHGPFTVKNGGYTVEFYGLVKKRFDLVPGGTIIWDGDPLAGRMNVQARYSTKVAPYPLVANARGGLTESERNTLQAPLPFDVLINIRESVQSPNITFGLDMDRQVRNSYPQVNSVLDQLSKPANQEELNRQVFGLLVLSTFIENEDATDQGGSSLASTAARNSVNSILTQQLNRLTGQGIKGMDIQLGVNTYDQTEGGESYSRTTVDYKVTQRILNERVSIEAGGSMGYNERKQDVSAMSNTKAPQYAIAYDITKDGRLRLRVYHENAYDLYDGELVNNGVAIMLTRDFEKHAQERDRRRQEILRQREAERNKENEP